MIGERNGSEKKLVLPCRASPPRVGPSGPPLVGRLKICSRCRATWYVDQKAQKAHWPLHKKSCKKITSKEANDLAACYNANRIFLAITRALPRGGNHLTAAQFRRIREIFDDGEDDGEGHEELDMNMQSFMRGLLFSHQDWGAERLWACPGMTQFMLKEWDAIRAEKKILLEHFPRGRPTSEYVKALGKTRFSSAQLAAISHFDAAENRCMQAPGSYRFCWLAFNLLMATAMRSQPSMSSVHDGRGTVRKESLVAYAASKRILELWCNKHVRRSCGDAMAPAVSFTLSFLQDEDLFLSLSYCPPESRVFPEGLVCAALAEFAQHGASKSYARKILT